MNKIESKIEDFDFNVVLAETQVRPLNERVRLDKNEAEKVENLYNILGEVEQVKQIYDNLDF